MNSTLETLRNIFPLVVADIIYFFLISQQKQDFNNQLKLAFRNNKVNKVLHIKSNKLSSWLINFEKVNIENYFNTSKNIENFEKQRKQILIDNHLSIKKWRERQKLRQV
jgi:hypothetical protein